MVIVTRKRQEPEYKGESISEFRARLQAKRIRERGLTSTEKRKLTEAGATKTDLLQSLDTVASTGQKSTITKRPKGSTLVTDSRGNQFYRTFIRSGDRIVVKDTPTTTTRFSGQRITIRPTTRTKKRDIERTVPFLSDITLSTLPKSKKVQQEEIKELEKGLVIPEKYVRQSLIPKREKQTVKLAQITDSGIKTLEVQARNLNDADLARRIVKLKQQGKLTKDVKENINKEIRKKRDKQLEAVAKIDLIFKKLDERNNNYERTVKRAFGFLLTNPRTGEKRKKEDIKFYERVLGKTAIKISKYANPFIIGDQIGGGLSALYTAKEAGLINPKEALKKGAKYSTKATAGLIKDIAKLDKKALKDRADKASVLIKKGASITARSLKTEEGLSTFIAIALLSGVPQKLIKSGIKVVGKGAKATVKVSPKLLKEVKSTSKSLLRSKKAQARVFRKSAKRLSKGELRKGASKKTFSPRQKKGIERTESFTRQQSRSTQAKAEKVLRQQFTKPKGDTKLVPVSKKTILVKRGKKVVDTIKVTTKSKGKSTYTQKELKDLTKTISKRQKDVTSGKSKLVQLAKSKSKKTTTPPTKSPKPLSKERLATIKARDRRALEQLSDKVVVNKRPEAIYKQYIEPRVTGGFRKGQKDILFKRLIEKRNNIFNDALKNFYDKSFTLQDTLPSGASGGFFRNIAKKKISIDDKVKIAIRNAKGQLKKYDSIFKGVNIGKDFKVNKDVVNQIKANLAVASLTRFSFNQKDNVFLRGKDDIDVSIKPKIKITQAQKISQDLSIKPITDLSGVFKGGGKTRPKKPFPQGKTPITTKPLPIKPLPKPLLKPKKIIKPRIIRKPKKPKIKIKIPIFKLPKPYNIKKRIKKSLPKPKITLFTPTLVRPRKRRKQELFTPINELFTGIELR